MTASTNQYLTSIYTLRDKVYREPTSRALRPDIVRYVRLCVDYAKQLPEDELLHGKGADPASRICGVLAWQGAYGVKGDDWITQKDEPELSRILELSSALDVDENNPSAWQELFEITEQLKEEGV